MKGKQSSSRTLSLRKLRDTFSVYLTLINILLVAYRKVSLTNYIGNRTILCDNFREVANVCKVVIFCHGLHLVNPTAIPNFLIYFFYI